MAECDVKGLVIRVLVKNRLNMSKEFGEKTVSQ